MKMTDESALLAQARAVLARYADDDAQTLVNRIDARLAADQQKGGGEVACHRWLRNGESTPSGWISGEPSARQIEAQQMCKEKFGDTADWQVEYAYKAPQPSIPAPAQQFVHGHRTMDDLPAQQDGKASGGEALTFDAFRAANVSRCLKWHPAGVDSWSPSDWLVAVTGEIGELASLLKMRNRERDSLPGNKFSPTDKMVADELADVVTYLDLLAYVLGVDLGRAAVAKFNEVSERVGFPDRIELAHPPHADQETQS